MRDASRRDARGTTQPPPSRDSTLALRLDSARVTDPEPDDDELPPAYARQLPPAAPHTDLPPPDLRNPDVRPDAPRPTDGPPAVPAAGVPLPPPRPAPLPGTAPAPAVAPAPAPAPLDPRGRADGRAPAPAPAPAGSDTEHASAPPSPRAPWRRIGGLVGARAAGSAERKRLERLTTPVRRPYRLSVTSIKGGVGKTTTSAMLGLTLARYRDDRVVTVDANPHAGTLADRLLGERVMPTVRDLINAELRERRLGSRGLTEPGHIGQYLGQAGRLMVAAGEQSPDLSETLDEEQYRVCQDVLERAFDIIITDSGTGMRHSAMRGTLAATDRLLVVAAPRFDAARRAAKTLDEVHARGYPHLVRDAVVVITMDAPKTTGINVRTLVDYFRQLCTYVVQIPYDQHLYAGGTIHYDRVSPATRGAYMDLAAALAEGFAAPPPGR
ncbi:MinD/ParA family ATP-binding protein [Streptomyces chumphonensis]|uniref:MinD/ParA family ATP-binding protein n=1 Tax=Streptomyces chumphonensis TaxID=1214925 RepID=UPI00362A358C